MSDVEPPAQGHGKWKWILAAVVVPLAVAVVTTLPALIEAVGAGKEPASGESTSSEAQGGSAASSEPGTSTSVAAVDDPSGSASSPGSAGAAEGFTLVYENELFSLAETDTSEYTHTVADLDEQVTVNPVNDLLLSETPGQELAYSSAADRVLTIPGLGSLHAPDDRPETADECARRARAGAVSKLDLWGWDPQVGSVLCLETDKGSIALVEVVGFGPDGPRVSGPPELIEFSATLWAPIP